MIPSGNDDSRPAGGCQMLGDVVHKQYFAAFGAYGEAAVRPDASFGRHKGRIGEYDIGSLGPALFAG